MHCCSGCKRSGATCCRTPQSGWGREIKKKAGNCRQQGNDENRTYVTICLPDYLSHLTSVIKQVYYSPCSKSLRAGVAQLVEYKLPKLGVAGSNPVARST